MQSGKQTMDATTSLFELENEIQETVQQLKHDLEENQTLYQPDDAEPETTPPVHCAQSDPDLENAVKDTLSAMHRDDHSKPMVSAASSNNTNFFTPHSVSHHGDRSDNNGGMVAVSAAIAVRA